jgi:hypothetical protein
MFLSGLGLLLRWRAPRGGIVLNSSVSTPQTIAVLLLESGFFPNLVATGGHAEADLFRCWDECSMTGSELPRFTAPLCSPFTVPPTALITATVPVSEIIESTAATRDDNSPTVELKLLSQITDLPASGAIQSMTVQPSEPTASNNTCTAGMTICIDYLTACGNDTVMYGGYETLQPFLQTYFLTVS